MSSTNLMIQARLVARSDVFNRMERDFLYLCESEFIKLTDNGKTKSQENSNG